jgi:predicted HD phosphohydrolase
MESKLMVKSVVNSYRVPHKNQSCLVAFTGNIMAPLFDLLERCQGVLQSPVHHPEGDVFVHSLQVMQWAFRESIDTDLILAAMLHDVGKAVSSLGHDKIGAKHVYPHVSLKTHWLIENHMRFWQLIMGDMKKKSKVVGLVEHPFLADLLQLARWDQLGRDPHLEITYDRDRIIDALNRCVEKRFGPSNLYLGDQGSSKWEPAKQMSV